MFSGYNMNFITPLHTYYFKPKLTTGSGMQLKIGALSFLMGTILATYVVNLTYHVTDNFKLYQCSGRSNDHFYRIINC